MKEFIFPEGFLWGAAASATQTEGQGTDEKGENVWDYWFKMQPELFHNQVGPNVASNFYHTYKEDIGLMKKIGFNSFRTSFSWARLIPDGDGEVSQAGIDFYNKVIDEMIAQGIEPIMNLYHFDMPMELQKIGGFENRYVVDCFARYAKVCFENFGDRVKKFVTFNEPIVIVECGYLAKFHYPCVVDMKRAAQVLYHVALSSAAAIKEYRQLKLNGEIGIIVNVSTAYPRDPNNPADVKAAELSDLIQNKSFIDPAILGAFPQGLIDFAKSEKVLPKYTTEDLAAIKNNTVDFVGINYYQPNRVKAVDDFKRKEVMFPWDFVAHYDMPGKKMNPHRGWEIYEKGIYDIAIRMRDEYNNMPWFISENGMGVEGEEKFLDSNGEIQDDYRIEFLREHLKWLHKGIEEGSNCFGYHMWTPFDCWSWLNSYKNRYGFIRVDLDNDYKRSIKKSGYWFKTVAEKNGFEAAEKLI